MTGPPGSPEAELARLVNRTEKLTVLLQVAKAMIEEHRIDPLLDLIVRASVKTVDAERCTLFLMDRNGQELWSKIAHGLEGVQIIRLPLGQGIAGQVAQTGKPLNIPDAYNDPRFNREIDVTTGYRTSSILCVPMLSRGKYVVGVMQALNHRSGPFTPDDEELLMALGANAAAAIESANLYEDIERLFEGFVTASVGAIEARDPTTSGHSSRVANLSVALFECLPLAGGEYANVKVRPRELRELRYAALLHDFGKVGVREHVLVKADKLHPHELSMIEARFEQARQASEIAMLKAKLDLIDRGGSSDEAKEIEEKWRKKDEQYAEMLDFIRRCNRPTVLDSGGFERLKEIAQIEYELRGAGHSLITNEELKNLSIPRGSLNDKERREIESHVVHTFNFLKKIPWTRELARIPDIAGSHHEKLDGTGYPRGLKADQIPVQSRVMTIADIYDALTAADRPYKSAMPHDRALDILQSEASRGKIDPALLDVFIEAKVPERAVSMSQTDLDSEFTLDPRIIQRPSESPSLIRHSKVT
jgi:HD-GYP domain-containing protein (c-di-GMP phosphodiesterase class II)